MPQRRVLFSSVVFLYKCSRFRIKFYKDNKRWFLFAKIAQICYNQWRAFAAKYTDLRKLFYAPISVFSCNSWLSRSAQKSSSSSFFFFNSNVFLGGLLFGFSSSKACSGLFFLTAESFLNKPNSSFNNWRIFCFSSLISVLI